jgi:hypothetical protein
MWMFKSSIVSLLVFLSSSATVAISGTYVGSGPDIAVLLQLVETNGDSCPAGTSSKRYLQATGLNYGGYGQTFHLNLARGTEEDFKTHAAGLSGSVNRAVATQNLEADLANDEHMLEAMSKFAAKPEPGPSAFIPYEQRYRNLTQGMRVALGRQQLIPRFIQTPARGQIGVAINQAAVETAQIHAEVKSKQAEFQQKVTAAFEKVAPIAKRCGDSAAQANIAPSTLEKLRLQCARCE